MTDTFKSIAALDDPAFLKSFTEEREALNDSARLHISNMLICDHDGIDRGLNCFRAINDQLFELPGKDTVKLTVKLLTDRGISKSEITRCIGIPERRSNPLLNKWMNEDSDSKINKSNWIVLATMAGLILPMKI